MSELEQLMKRRQELADRIEAINEDFPAGPFGGFPGAGH